ncbi:tyrosine-type recombinase/integrase [Parahaliea mediterranea]|uniref:tyrosine-type recombinase/integrase n=1 Tax=Parahaliea mediterranea TaxID=651086 RepID=UPI000E2F1FE0|nr:hypothetical protein [Parahaliea mediterranea]
MDRYRGIEEHGNRIRIRFQFKGRKYVRYLDKPWGPKRNRAEAFRRREQYITRLKAGLTIDELDTDPENPSFYDMSELYLKSLKRKDSTRASYQQIINQFWMPHLENVQMLHMNYAQVLAADSATEWTSAKTRRNAIIPLSGVFKLAISSLEDFNTNFASKLPKEDSSKDDVDPFTIEEKAEILAALEELKETDALDYFTLGFELGCRLPGELNALRWQDYHEKKLVHINKAIVRRKLTTTKTHSDRKVLLTPAAKAVLERRVRPIKGGYIFTNSQGGPHLDGDIMNGKWRDAIGLANQKREAAKLDPIRYRRAYNCRHTRASLDLGAGGKPAFLASQLGHTLEQFFNTYATWINSKDDEAELATILAGHAQAEKRRQSQEEEEAK